MGEAAKNTLSIVPKTTRYSPFKFNSLISGVGVPVLVDLVHVDKVQGSDEFSAFNRIAGVTDLGGLMRGYKLEIKHENPGIVIYKDGRAFGRVAKEQPKDLIEILLSSKFFKSAFYFVPLSDSDSDEENTFQEDPKEPETNGTKPNPKQLENDLENNCFIQCQARLTKAGLNALQSQESFIELEQAIAPFKDTGISLPSALVEARKKFAKLKFDNEVEDDRVIDEATMVDSFVHTSQGGSSQDSKEDNKTVPEIQNGRDGSKDTREPGESDIKAQDPLSDDLLPLSNYHVSFDLDAPNHGGGNSTQDLSDLEDLGQVLLSRVLKSAEKKLRREKKKKKVTRGVSRKILDLKTWKSQIRQAKRSAVGYPNLD